MANRTIRIRYAEDETGWAEDFGDGRARIANVPYAEGLNLDDIVELVHLDPGELPYAGRLLVNQFPRKMALNYPEPHRENFKTVVWVLESAGCKVEGAVAGLCVVAHKDDVDPPALLNVAGLNATPFVEDPA
jgi:hypothetical protein